LVAGTPISEALHPRHQGKQNKHKSWKKNTEISLKSWSKGSENDFEIVYKHWKFGEPQGAVGVDQEEGGNLGELKRGLKIVLGEKAVKIEVSQNI
jgi:hypothetical protein